MAALGRELLGGNYNDFIQKRLSQVPGVQAIESRIVLEETKNTTELPLELATTRPE